SPAARGEPDLLRCPGNGGAPLSRLAGRPPRGRDRARGRRGGPRRPPPEAARREGGPRGAARPPPLDPAERPPRGGPLRGDQLREGILVSPLGSPPPARSPHARPGHPS